MYFSISLQTAKEMTPSALSIHNTALGSRSEEQLFLPINLQAFLVLKLWYFQDPGMELSSQGKCLIKREGYFLKIFHLFIHERHTERERGRDIGRERSRLHAGSLMWDSILGLQDYALGQRQMLNCWVIQGSPRRLCFKLKLLILKWKIKKQTNK